MTRILQLIKKLWKQSKKDDEFFMKKFLIVGLGNPGLEYKYTRHNIGFLAVDNLAEQINLKFLSQRYGDVAIGNYKGKRLVILKPTTYMNLSGKAVRYWLEKEKIEKENLLVITDDVNLDFGTIRIRPKGSDGGHNGLKSIQELLGTNQYTRLRFGIGKDYHRGQQADYVLGKWTDEQIKELPKFLEQISKATINFVQEGLQRTMNKFNTPKNKPLADNKNE